MKKKLKDDYQGIPGRGQLNELTPEELINILEAHQIWLASDGKEGVRANLQKLNLFQRNLSGANLEQALLGESDLRGANLYKANLRKSDLSQTNFHNSDLRYSDFTEAINLQAKQLSGANLSNSKLPECINQFNGLKNIEEASKNAKRVFFLIILSCIYSWLTMGTSTSVDLITNYPVSRLPIIAVPMRLATFYLVTSALILFIYFYYQIIMQRLWELISSMPAIFPDGESLDRKIYPWLITGTVRAYFKNMIINNKLPLGGLQGLLTIVSTWIIVPITLYLFWGNYLIRHDIVGSCWLLLILSLSIAFSFFSYSSTRRTITKAKKASMSLSWGLLIVIIVFAFGFPISFGIIYGLPSTFAEELGNNDIRILVPRIFATRFDQYTGYSFHTGAVLIESDLSIKPPNWTGTDIKELYYVKGAYLKGINLRNAIAVRCFLVKADLRMADMQGANFRYADLRKTDLKGANLTRANLSFANLRWADLSYCILREADLWAVDLQNTTIKFANLQDTNLIGVNLKDANLYGSSLKNANLGYSADSGANLKGVNLDFANLQGANLKWTRGLTKSQVRKASNFLLAYYDGRMLEQFGLPKNHNEMLRSKNLSGANLQGANLAGANLSGFDLQNADLRGAILSVFIPHEPLFQMTTLQGANLKNSDLRKTNFYLANLKNVNFEGAKLNKANLGRADLTGATGLTREQIESAIIDKETILPNMY